MSDLIRKQIIQNGMRDLGLTEMPPGSNIVKYNDWYYETGSQYHIEVSRSGKAPAYAWCGAFVAYLYHFSNVLLPKGLHDCIGYVPAAQNWLRAKKEQTDQPKPGDIVIYDWNQDGFEEHIGVFVGWEDDRRKYAICIEGNTSPDEDGSQSNGGMVCQKRRHISKIEGFYNLID